MTQTKLNGTITITGVDNEIWTIEQDCGNDNIYGHKKFFVTSSNGYNGYEGNGFHSLISAIQNVNKHIRNYHLDRCL